MGRTMTLEQKATRRQARLDKRRRNELPLFAGTPLLDELQPLPTVPEIVTWYEQIREYHEAKSAEMRRRERLDYLRWLKLATRYLTIQQMAHIDSWAWRTYPTQEYVTCHWYEFLIELGAFGAGPRDERERIHRWWQEHPIGYKR